MCDDRARLGYPEPLQCAASRDLVLHLQQGGKRRHGGRKASVGEARQLVREHRDLLLGGEDDIDFLLLRHCEQVVEPVHGSRTERRDRHEGMHVPGEPGEAQGAGHGHGNVVSHAVQLGRHLTGRQPCPFGEKDSHAISI